jgi:DTW domain-containing protein YfiP
MTHGMDLKTYLSRREEQKQGESFREVCLRCFRPKISCFCGDIESFDTRTHFVILMHPKEAKKVKMGTSRLTQLFLSNSEIRIGLDFTDDERVNVMIKDPRFFPVVLFPGENSVEITGNDYLINNCQNKNLLVLVVDASWPLAKKILRESRNLHDLPQIHFRPEASSRYILKKQPHPYCLCTIESVSFLLEELENVGLENCQGKQKALRDALDKMCQLQSEFIDKASLSGFPREKWLNPKTRSVPGKRQRRSVSFDNGNEH